jgi:chitodextrinase
VANSGTPLNPYGCWDWWGSTDFNCAVKTGRQIAPVTDGTAPNGLRVNDISDTAAALAWTPLMGALSYTAYRASGADQNFASIGTVAGPSFSDAGLSPATSYAYKVTANAGGSEGPASTVVTATTLPVPPRCPAPGSCPVAR